MDHFANSPVGQLGPVEVPLSAEMVRQQAFVPSPLPDHFELSQATWSAAINAAVELGRLTGLTRHLELPAPLLTGLTLRREAFSTSTIEGTYAPTVDVLATEASQSTTTPAPTAAITEVLNFVRAADHGAKRLTELPVCMRLACEMQSILVKDTPSEDWQRGKIRTTQVIVGAGRAIDPAEKLRRARFVPSPPGQQLIERLSQWERWSHDAPIHPLVRIAVSHYQFEVLHPFTDGNGRIGRLLAILQLIEAGVLEAPVINLSPYIEVRRDRYIDLLERVSAEGAWDDWITFFVEALGSQAIDSLQRVHAILDWRKAALDNLRASRVRGTAHLVVDDLMQSSMTTARRISDHHGVSITTANHALRRLSDLNIVREVTGRSYNRVFAAPELLNLLNRPAL